MKKEILFIEPFYGGSHKSWINQVIEHSKHNYDLLTLQDKYWKWRMHGSAIKLAEKFIENNKVYDSIICSDMIDLTTFLALTRFKIPKETKIILYFHENQFAYPWQADSEDVRLNREFHYGFINYSSALVADEVLYNSSHNMESFLAGARQMLKTMPDAKCLNTIDVIRCKSKVLPLGLDIPLSIEKEIRDIPLILWNHRWEYDKNPDQLFRALIDLFDEGLKFNLALLGSPFKNGPEIFKEVKEKLSEIIIYEGYMTGDDYKKVLLESSVIPVTSIHDFFGLSIMEAIANGVIPLLPTRLSYPELYKPLNNPEIFYSPEDNFKERLKHIIINYKEYDYHKYAALTTPYHWKNMIKIYDDTF